MAMKTDSNKNTVVFFDFDNTITTRDVFDDMLLRFAEDDSWRSLEERWKNKEIGSRQCLKEQISTINITKSSLDRYLATIKLDPYFKRVIRLLKQRCIKTVILSDNFDYILKRILRKNGINGLEVYSNKARIAGNRLIPSFPFTDGKCRVCAHCKKKTMFTNGSNGSFKIYIGDGQSDICPAEHADRVFAKESLLDYCRKEGISHIPYKNLKKVYNYLKEERING